MHSELGVDGSGFLGFPEVRPPIGGGAGVVCRQDGRQLAFDGLLWHRRHLLCAPGIAS